MPVATEIKVCAVEDHVEAWNSEGVLEVCDYFLLRISGPTGKLKTSCQPLMPLSQFVHIVSLSRSACLELSSSLMAGSVLPCLRICPSDLPFP